MSYLKKYLDYIVLIPSILIVFGCVKLYIFYIYFKINIFQYISLSESLVLFLSDVAYYTSFIIGFILIRVFQPKFLAKRKIKIDEIRDSKNTLFFKYLYSLKSNIVFFILYLCLLGYVFSFDRRLVKYFIFLFVIFEFLSFFFLALYPKLLKKYTFNVFVDIYNSIVITSFFLGFLLLISFLDAYSIDTGYRNKGTVVITKDSTYNCKNSIHYIGKTEKYLFLQNTKDTSNIVIPISEVKTIKLKSEKAKIQWFK